MLLDRCKLSVVRVLLCDCRSYSRKPNRSIRTLASHFLQFYLYIGTAESPVPMIRHNRSAVLVMSSGKPRVPKVLTSFSSKSTCLSCFAMSALLMLASVFVPVCAQIARVTGVPLGSYPGTGNTPPFPTPSPPLLSPISPPFRRRFAAL